MAIEKESDLYLPIKLFLEEQGYAVQAEVKGCDVVGVRGDEIIVIELKKQFSLKLVLQAIKRQEVCSSVYMAFPITKAIQARRRLNEIKALAKRLHLGLMFVHDRPSGLLVEVPLLPNFDVFRTNIKAQKAFTKELFSREHSVNTGGVTKQKVMTAHKERGLMLAAFLQVMGPRPLSEIKLYMNDPLVGATLSANHYGWYMRISRGVYGFDAQKEAEFHNYSVLSAFYITRATHYSQGLEPPFRASDS